jgi:ADP-heptose:LPS heptosyltransferase
MGSLVLARQMLSRLQARYSTEAVHVLTFEKNRPLLDLLGTVPAGNVLTVSDRSFSSFLTGCLTVWSRCLARPFDIAVDCELFSRVGSIMSYLSGAVVRAGFHPHTQEGLYRGSFINRAVLYNPYRHITDQFLTLADAIASQSVPRGKEPVRESPAAAGSSELSPDELTGYRRRLYRDFPALEGQRLVLVNPSGGALPIRAWPLESYQILCEQLLGDGNAVAVIGLAEDAPFGAAISERCRRATCVDLTGHTATPRELLALFACADLLVSNDSGTAQLAALSALPAIVLFGPETPVLYGPRSPRISCLFSGIPCSPCLSAYNHRNSPCDGDNQCLKSIAPEVVVARSRELLLGVPRTT